MGRPGRELVACEGMLKTIGACIILLNEPKSVTFLLFSSSGLRVTYVLGVVGTARKCGRL